MLIKIRWFVCFRLIVSVCFVVWGSSLIMYYVFLVFVIGGMDSGSGGMFFVERVIFSGLCFGVGSWLLLFSWSVIVVVWG